MILGEYIHTLTKNGVNVHFDAPEFFAVGMHIDMEFHGIEISKFIPNEDFSMKISEDQVILDTLKSMSEEIDARLKRNPIRRG